MKVKRYFLLAFAMMLTMGFLVQPSLAETTGAKTTVKLEWEIANINVNYKTENVWDADHLVWTEKKVIESVEKPADTFTLTNRSGSSVVANVAFAVETALADTFDEATYENNDCTIANGTAQTITATLSLKKDAFANVTLPEEATQYGTYTVTISEAK